MKKAAFWIRTAILLVAAVLPALHPGVVRAFDASRLWFSFVLVPASCVLAFYGRSMPRIGKYPAIIPVAFALVLCTLWIDGFTVTFLSAAGWALAAYAGTALVFRKNLYALLYFEPLWIVWAAWRLSEFSRSTQAMADASRLPVAVIFAAAIAAWVLYAAVIYLLEYTRGQRLRKKGFAPLALALVATVALFAVALWRMPETIGDYIQRINTVDERIPPKRGRDDVKGKSDASNGERASDGGDVVETGDGNWLTNPEKGKGKGNQQMVMVVESPVDTLYLAESYLGNIDPVRGFVADPDYYANALAHTPYLETWENPDIGTDGSRMPVWIEVYSSIPDKLASWLPYMIEPTVLDEKNFPLRYHYRALSLVSSYSLTGFLPFIPPLAGKELDTVASSLEVPIPEPELAPFREYLANLLEGEETYEGKIRKIFEGFKDCRYEAGGADDTSVQALAQFLFVTKTGDCTEFSNTAALLARLSGIPSRVATGYAVRKELQTSAHKDGIRKIVGKFPPLAGKDPDRLFLVTTAHAHSWPEFYIPGAGWVDFESTENALPPETGGDPNSSAIVIPEFDSLGGDLPARAAVPWLLLGKLALLAAAIVIVARWVRRLAILLALSLTARRPDPRGAKARFRLFTVRLASRGYRAKRKSETPREYGASYPELESIMACYEIAVLHPDSAARFGAKKRLDGETRAFLASRRGLLASLRELSGFYDGGLL